MTDDNHRNHHAKSPVLFLVFNRPDATRRVLEAIRQAQPTTLYVAADGPRPNIDGDAEKCEEVRKIATTVDWPCTVKTLFREKNLGCKYAVAGAISWFFEQEPEGIILEDDCVPSNSFFRFCDELLPMYRYDTRIMTIAGYNVLSGHHASTYSYLFSDIGFSWGWATWRRAWSEFDIRMEAWQEITKRGLQNFEPFGKHRNRIFSRVSAGEIDSWHYLWDFCRLVNSGLTVVPNLSLTKNIGFGGDATHTKSANSARALVAENEIEFPLRHPWYVLEDKQYSEAFWKQRRKPMRKRILSSCFKLIRRLMGK